MATDDQALLRRFCAEGDHEAFNEVVRRHVGLVYGAALRQLGDPTLAEDATQIVFTRLAQRAAKVPQNAVLAGWLHADTRLTALQLQRRERRRRNRELELIKMQEVNENQSPDWTQIRPVLDEALQSLGRTDRDILLLRFFEQRNLRDVAAAMGLSEDAARMRVARALDKLRSILQGRGIATAGEAMAAMLAACGVQAVPPALAMSVAASALAASSPVAGMALGVIAMSKIKLAVIGTLFAAGVATPVLWQRHLIESLQIENAALRAETVQLRLAEEENDRRWQARGAEANRSREDAMELARLRGALAQARQELEAQRKAASALSGSPSEPQSATPEEPVVTEAEIAAFLQRPTGEQAVVLAQLRRQMMGLENRKDGEFARTRALAEGVRPKLEELESDPKAFAEFQSSFIESAIGLQDSAKLARIRQIVQDTYHEAVSEKLDASSRPEEEVEVERWALRRDALDRRATHAVQQLLTSEERGRFDRTFLGIMGIDLGLNDGAWHRFVTPDGGVTFPSQDQAP